MPSEEDTSFEPRAGYGNLAQPRFLTGIEAPALPEPDRVPLELLLQQPA